MTMPTAEGAARFVKVAIILFAVAAIVIACDQRIGPGWLDRANIWNRPDTAAVARATIGPAPAVPGAPDASGEKPGVLETAPAAKLPNRSLPDLGCNCDPPGCNGFLVSAGEQVPASTIVRYTDGTGTIFATRGAAKQDGHAWHYTNNAGDDARLACVRANAQHISGLNVLKDINGTVIWRR